MAADDRTRRETDSETRGRDRSAAGVAGVGERTLRRWLQSPEFSAAYRHVRRELVENAIARVQSAAGQAVDTPLKVAQEGAKDSDRVRAALALLDHALRGLTNADALHGPTEAGEVSSLDTSDIVKLLARRLQQLERAELPTAEKSRLTASLADALLRAIGVGVLDQRLEALQSVLKGRKDKES